MRNKLKRNDLLEGIIWNYGSLAILSASGFIFSCLIIYFYDASALGVFNQVYAWYCVISQITVWGIHMSVMKLTPEYKEDLQERSWILSSALIGVLISSFVTVSVLESILPWIITENTNFLLSMQLAMPGLIFFSLNKVILNYLNGLSEMKAYAFFQSLRYISITFTIYLCGILQSGSKWLSFSFTVSEIIVFLFSIFYLFYRKLYRKCLSIKHLKEHLQFGTRILPANMVLELNTKVDIICLGLILKDDYQIGIYSFAILFVEGFYQLYITVRRSFNPKITECSVKNNLKQGIEEMRQSLKKYLRFLSPAAVVLVALGYYIVCCILNQRDYIIGIKYLLIICIAIAINGSKIILGNIFAQLGFPVYESMINTITVAANFLFNILLIYQFGLLGAAIATAISHIIFGSILKYYVKRKLKINI